MSARFLQRGLTNPIELFLHAALPLQDGQTTEVGQAACDEAQGTACRMGVNGRQPRCPLSQRELLPRVFHLFPPCLVGDEFLLAYWFPQHRHTLLAGLLAPSDRVKWLVA